jgi:site-specific DNA-methyltransferase (adenine-specific)
MSVYKCDRKIGPYPCCSVVEGDCLELMKALPNGCVDAVITDPPYGIGLCRSYVEHAAIAGDDEPFDPAPFLSFKRVILWGGNNFSNRLPIGGWFLWDKRCSVQADRMYGSAFELAWCNDKSKFKMKRLLHGGAVNADGWNEPRFHPTQKPVEIMEWCMDEIGDWNTVLDPFCGSGTTLVAAKKLGRHFLGFEISHDYCEIARKRLAEIDANPTLFNSNSEQMTL